MITEEKEITDKEKIDLFVKKIREQNKEIERLKAYNKKLIEIISSDNSDNS
jgi:hypothetical protein